MSRKIILFLAIVLFCSRTLAQVNVTHAQYLGRYTDGRDYAVYFHETPFGLTLRPALWTATQLLQRDASDSFVVVDRRERGAKFERDASGRVVGVTIRGMEGEGLKLTRANSPLLPIELLLAGRVQESAGLYLAQVKDNPTRIIESAQRVLNRFPSKSRSVAGFLSIIATRFPRSAALQTLLGTANVMSGYRRAARINFQRAHQLDLANTDAVSGLAMLHALPTKESAKDNPWPLPFSLAAVFAPPTTAEIRVVETDWRRRDLGPHDVREVTPGQIKFGDDEFNVRIVSHSINGQKHYGAIIVPNNATAKLPVIVEAKGVSWNYFPLDLNRLDAPSFMGDARRQFIYVVPSYRGEVLHFNNIDYHSEGDRTNAWDGATDDALALLNVALATTPAADANRVGAFGRSRGGSVALLMGERDSRIKCVVEWSGPADWFSLMGTEGWTQSELFGEGLRTRAKPNEVGGQLVEHFLLKAVRGEEDLSAVRRRMIAGSPVYFTNRLPKLQMHYGIEDTSVPVRNGLRIADSLKMSRTLPEASIDPVLRRALRTSATVIRRHGNSQAFFYPGQGHDTDRLLAPALSREFFIKSLLRNDR